MILTEEKNNQNILLSYKHYGGYVSILDKTEEEYYENMDRNEDKGELKKFYNWIDAENSPNLKEKVEREIFQETHKRYYNSLECSLKEVISDFKSILNKYDDPTIQYYKYEGVYFEDNWRMMVHVGGNSVIDKDFRLNLEGFRLNLEGKPLSEFIELLEFHQNRKKDIKITEVKCELSTNKN